MDIFLIATLSRLNMGSTQPPMQFAPEADVLILFEKNIFKRGEFNVY
jgi:hypothetical protein